MIIETEKFNILCDQLEKFSEKEKITPEEHAEALDLMTQAEVARSNLFGAAVDKLSEVRTKLGQVKVEVEEPEDANETEPKDNPNRRERNENAN